MKEKAKTFYGMTANKNNDFRSEGERQVEDPNIQELTMAKKKITLIFRPNGNPVHNKADKDSHPHAWQVEDTHNSTNYHPGEYLTKVRVDSLCESEDWDVKIIPVETLKHQP